jgi:hypothetical protein
MKHYLIIVQIYDGDHEYWDKVILHLEDIIDDTRELEILKQYTGDDNLKYDDWLRAYMDSGCYRGYRVYTTQEIDKNDLAVLRKYHI